LSNWIKELRLARLDHSASGCRSGLDSAGSNGIVRVLDGVFVREFAHRLQ
jgi:hypothetical protein